MDERYEEIEPVAEAEQELVQFVVEKCTAWRDHRNTNHLDKWEQYD